MNRFPSFKISISAGVIRIVSMQVVSTMAFASGIMRSYYRVGVRLISFRRVPGPVVGRIGTVAGRALCRSTLYWTVVLIAWLGKLLTSVHWTSYCTGYPAIRNYLLDQLRCWISVFLISLSMSIGSLTLNPGVRSLTKRSVSKSGHIP